MERFARFLNPAYALSRVIIVSLVSGLLGCGQSETETTSSESAADNVHRLHCSVHGVL